MQAGDFYAILSGFFWSISVILMRVSGMQIAPLPLTFFKSTIAVVCFVILSRAWSEPLIPDLTGEAYGRLVISAVLGISFADTMFAAALNRLGASLQALADCVYAPAIAVVGFVMFGETLGFWEMLGGMLVVSGVLVGMRVTPEVASRSDLVVGVALAVGAHVIMAVGILLVRDVYRELSVVWVSGFRFLVATLILGVVGGWRADRGTLLVGFRRRDLWRAMLPMTFCGPFLATLFWVAGFKYNTAGRAAIYNQLSTVFIIILAVIFLHEGLTWRKVLGVGLAILGTLLVGFH